MLSKRYVQCKTDRKWKIFELSSTIENHINAHLIITLKSKQRCRYLQRIGTLVTLVTSYMLSRFECTSIETLCDKESKISIATVFMKNLYYLKIIIRSFINRL